MKRLIVESGSRVFSPGWLDQVVRSRSLWPEEEAEAHTFLCSLTSEATLWMMDCSEEVQCVSEEPGAQMELKKGMSIFIDVSKKKFWNPYSAYSINVFHLSL